MAPEPSGPSGYDVAYSPGVDPNRPGSDIARLPLQQIPSWYEALEALLKDPTPDNPTVFDASNIPPYQRYEHVMVWGQLVIVYRFLNYLVIEILSVDVRRALLPGEVEDEDE